MNLAAFFAYGGCVNIFFHSIIPNGSFFCSSPHFSSQLAEFAALCQDMTHRLMPVTTLTALSWTSFQLNGKARSPFLAVLICTMSELCDFFMSLCKRRIFGSGAGAKTWRSFPFFSFDQDSFYLSAINLRWIALTTAWRIAIGIPGESRSISNSTIRLLRFFLSLHPVDSFAALSACSFPSIPMWAGTQWNSTVLWFSRNHSIIWTMSIMIVCAELRLGFVRDQIAAWLSVKIMIVVLVSVSVCAKAIWRAKRISATSAAYTVRRDGCNRHLVSASHVT